jgi:hypothetical protein
MADLILVFADREGDFKTTRLDVGSAAIGLIESFVTFVKSSTDAKLMSYTVVTEVVVPDDDFSDGNHDLVDQVLISTWKLPDGTVKRVSMPAPKDESLDANEDMSSDAAEDYGDALKALFGVANVQFRGGRLYRKASDRPKKLVQTGV